MGSLTHFPKVAEWLRGRGVAGVATGQVRESKIFTSIFQTFLMGSDRLSVFVSLPGVAGSLGSPSLGSREKSCENPALNVCEL